MAPLDRKLFRDLWRMKGQTAAIAAVIAVGVLLLVMMSGLMNSLEETKRAYFERYRLADIFVSLTRAPERTVQRIAELPGVALAEARIIGSALVDIEGEDLPIRAQAVSLPQFGGQKLNVVHLASGRMPDRTRPEEILLLTAFANAHGLKPGDGFSATMNGARHRFTIAGLAGSPEFLYTTAPGEMIPDDSRFAVLWLNHDAMAAAFDMKGAFNEVVVGLSRGASAKSVMAAADRILDRYGGRGAYGVEEQASNRFVSEEIKQLRRTGTMVPPIFLAVAAFLLYIVILRMVQAEREEIGLVKAFGYTDLETGWHYFKFVLIVAIVGALSGCLLGILAGRAMVGVYLQYFKFPFLVFKVDPASFAIGMATSIAAASAGSLFVLRKVFALTPATAMRPPSPTDFSRLAIMPAWMRRWLDQPARMVVRRMLREPVRMAGAVVGVAAGMALSVSMLLVFNGFDRTVDVSFNVMDRSDLTVTFTHPQGMKVLHELASIEGVLEAEPVRIVSVEFRNGLAAYRSAVFGIAPSPRLNRVLDTSLARIELPENGVVLGKGLARILGISPGDRIVLDVKEGARPVLELPVSGVAETLMGSPAYMDMEALNRAIGEPRRVSAAYLRVDSAQTNRIYARLKELPGVAGVSVKANAQAAFQRQMDEGAGAVRYVMALIAGIITFGIVYNTARIGYSERARDLAGLRVIGFTRAETAFVLLGELAIVILVALPAGALAGTYLNRLMVAGFSNDLYQVPQVHTPESYGVAAVAVIAAALVSGWLVKREMDRADLVAVLKTRD